MTITNYFVNNIVQRFLTVRARAARLVLEPLTEEKCFWAGSSARLISDLIHSENMAFIISQEEAEKRLTENDKRTVTERAKRLVALGGITINLVERMVPNLMSEYHREASDSFINGNYRNCIFSCSAALDQIIRHELIAGDDEPVKRRLN